MTPVMLGLLFAGAAHASNLDAIGVTALRELVPSLTGTGVLVAQPEAGSPAWEVNPATTGLPASLFTWLSSGGSASTFPNALGQESGHADEVAGNFYGVTLGVAPGVAHVNSYEAGYLAGTLVPTLAAIPAAVVNQSFIMGGQVSATDLSYDRYVATFNTIFCSGSGNSGAPNSPSTAFNGLSVGSSSGGGTSVGPTSDGRCKPDISAPGDLTSFSTALVSGCATILMQAGARGDGGAGTVSAATNVLTIKALLLNGAAKPASWTNTPTQPLDFLYGAGVVNALNSYRQLRGGAQIATVSNTMSVGGAHLPPSTANNVPARRGWNLPSISTSIAPPRDAVHHYFFDLRNDSNRVFTLTATLVWNRQFGQTAINNLDLFLYDAGTSILLAASQSAVDNVEHLYVTNLPPRRYDLQVLKRGGVSAVTQSETYALAFDFGPPIAAQLANPSRVGNAFQVQVMGEPYTRYAVLGTDDFLTWTPVATNTTPSAGFFTYTNAAAGSLGQQFYRTRWLP